MVQQTLLEMGSGTAERDGLASNNPFRSSRTSVEPGRIGMQEGQQQVQDSEKQVASSEVLSGPDNAPTPVEPASSAPAFRLPNREADKEVTSSWQTESQDQSGPIPMAYHPSNPQNSAQADRFINDAKGPPPAYDSLDSQGSPDQNFGSASSTSPTSLEPESAEEILTPQPEDKSAVGQLLAWIPPAPRHLQHISRLTQPVIIPQLDVPPRGESVPFQRCYSDALAAHGVSMQEFTHFLDRLEIAQLPSTGAQRLRMFGAGLTYVPIPVLNTLTGRGISALGSSGSGHSGARARLYMEQARERYFKPRGLQVTMVKDGDLNPRLQVPAHAPQLGMLTQNTVSATSCQRRMEALAPYAAPLRFDVPEPDKQVQGVQKMARKHLNSRFKEKARQLDPARKLQLGLVPPQAVALDERYREKLSEVRSAQYALIHVAGQPGPQEKGSPLEQAQEALRQRQHELQLIVSDRQNQGRNDATVAAEVDEVNWTKRLKWLVIESL